MKKISLIIILISSVFFAFSSSAKDAEDVLLQARQERYSGNSIAAINLYTDVLRQYDEDAKADTVIARALVEGGTLCYNEERFVEALDFYTAGIKAAKASGSARIHHTCLGNIGNIFAYFQDFEKSNTYYKDAYDSAVATRDYPIAAVCAYNIVANYCFLGQVDKAKEWLRLAMQMPDNDESNYYKLVNQAFIACTEGQYSTGAYYSREAINYLDGKNLHPSYIISAYSQLAESYHGMNMLDSCLSVYDQGLQLADESNQVNAKAALYLAIANVYAEMGDSASDVKYRAMHQTLSDSILNYNRFNQAQHKLHLLEEAEKEARISELHTQVIIAVSTTIFVLILVVALIVLLLRNKRLLRSLNESNQALFEKNEELTRKFYESMQPQTAPLEEEAESPDDVACEILPELVAKIDAVMKDEEAICDPEFSIAKLARMVGSNTTYVSRAINSNYGKNFKTLLNENRIKVASRLLGDSCNPQTITVIAQKSGYNSVNNFILSFKKHVGLTPAVYQKLAAEKSTTFRACRC